MSPVKLVAPESSRRVVSRRKERRWTNDRRIGAQAYASGAAREAALTSSNDAAYGMGPELFNVRAASKIIYEQEYSSCFEDFTNELRREFLNCEGGFVRAGAVAGGAHRNRRSSQSNTPATRFARVDRNLKHHLMETGRREPFSTFLAELEALLLAVLDREDPPTALTKVVVGSTLARALKREARVCMDEGAAPAVELVFKSGVYRLLTHGLCQFHGLASRSKDNPADRTERVLCVHNPRFDPLMVGWTLQDNDVTSATDQDSPQSLMLMGEATFPLVPYLMSRAY